jgi:hypothetical protein
MPPSGVDTFAATIPGTALTVNGSYVKYFIRATDNQGFSAIYPDTTTGFNVFRIVNGGINTVSQLQETPYRTGASIYANQRLTGLNIRGKIVSTINPGDLGAISFQDGTGPFSGIMLRSNATGNLDLVNRGDSIRITAGRLIEDFGITTLTDVDYTFISNTPPLSAITIPIDSILARSYDYTEAYESMLIQFDSVYVISNNADAPSNFGEFAIYPDSSTLGTGLRVRTGPNTNGLSSPAFAQNFNVDSLVENEKLDFIRGILTFNFGNWKLIPRSLNDVSGFAQGSGTSVSPAYNNVKNLRIYPNPNSGSFMLDMNLEVAEKLEISVHDITGRILLKELMPMEKGIQRYPVNVNGLSQGMYFLRVQGNGSYIVERFIVKH